jgi:dTDP-4-dehydrorhamnose reductase
MFILIVGASGFLGSRLFDEMSKQHIVSGTYFSRPRHGFVPLDVRDRKQVANVLKTTRPDVLIDCGGMTRPDQCEQEPELAHQVNADGIGNLVEFCRCKVIYFSTDYVFDGTKGQYTETDETRPVNHYGRTKLEAEKTVLSDSRNVVIRVSGLYGDNQQNDEFLHSLSGPTIYRAHDCFSSNLFLDDAVQHLSFFWSASGIYHLTDGERLSRYEFASKAVSILGLPVKVIAKPASDIFRIAQRPRDSSLISVRYSLPVQGADAALTIIKSRLRQEMTH